MANGADIGALAQQPQGQIDPDQTPEAVEGRKKQWLDYFKQPEVQSALIQFGVAALQPPSPGQSPAGQISASLAQGAEAATRVGDRKQAQASRAKEEELAERRTVATEQAAATGEKRVTLEQQRIDAQASQFAQQLQAELGIAAETLEAKLLLETVKGEVNTAFLEGRAVDLDLIRQQFTALSAVRTAGAGTGAPGTAAGGVAKPDINTLSEEDWKLVFSSPENEAITRQIYPEASAIIDAKKKELGGAKKPKEKAPSSGGLGPPNISPEDAFGGGAGS